MNKAYNRVEWSFLSSVLRAYGFAESWISPVMTLVSTVSYTYQVNGFTSRKVIPRRGLRQGDPLSPYLFILVLDVLSRLISDACGKDLLHGIHLADSAPPLSLLFFADNAILFTRDTQEDVYQLINILNIFTSALGKKLNLSKSGIICGGRALPEFKVKVSAMTNIPLWDSLGKYLGIPAEWGGSKIQGLSWLKEKVINRLEGWKGKILNAAGKEVLIKAVIQAIPSYIMAILQQRLSVPLLPLVLLSFGGSHQASQGAYIGGNLRSCVLLKLWGTWF